MPVAKLTACSTPDAMKSEERNDSLDNFIRQAIGKEPFLSFSRAGDSPVQWIQLLHALDQQGTSKFSNGPKINNPIEGRERSLEYCNGLSSYASEVNGVKESVHHIKSGGLPVKGAKNDSEHMQSLKIPEAVVAFAQAAAKANGEPEKYLPGWPLLTSLKVQMQKCDKCSREFCSPINYRRHIRVHRRSWNLDKDSALNRDLLGAFWDKLSPDEAKEIVSFNDVTLEEVPGSSIIRALTAFIRKLGFSSLPQVCVRAGSALLDIFQARPSRFPISSQELFSVLDDASEKTFLCGTALSIQKYVFDGEAGKIGLETKNLVACTSFLVEQKLIKAWLADKDAEALRCQKLLVEEEEAAQRRQAMLLERKRQKKLRQKEQKAKEQTNGESTDFKEAYVDSLEGVPSAETSSPLVASDSNSPTAKTLPDHVLSSLELIQLSNIEEDVDTEAQSGYGSGYSDTGTCQNVEPRMVHGTGRRHLIVARWQVPKSQMGVRNGFHATQNPQVLKLGAVQKHGTHRDQRAAPVVNGNKVWTRKPKSEIGGESLKHRLQNDAINQPDQNKNSEVLIGSISVTLGNCSGQQQGDSLAGARDNCAADHSMPKKNNVQEKPGKPDSAQLGTNRSTVKLWRPVSRHETGGPMPVQSGNRESEVDMITGRGNERTLSSESCLTSCAMDDNCCGSGNNSHSLLEESACPGVLLFSSRVAEAFLTQRWKEAIAADHVKLVLSPESEPPGCPEIQNDGQVAAPTSDFQKRSILGNAENWLANVGALESSTTGTAKAKFRTKTEKGVKLKYIPKQRTIT